MGQELIVNRKDITNVIDIYERNNEEYRIVTSDDIDEFVHKKTEDYINSDNQHAKQLLMIKKGMKVSNVIYTMGMYINIFLLFFSTISLSQYFVIFLILASAKCMQVFIFQMLKKNKQDKIKNEIFKIIHDGEKMDVYNIHIPLKDANMEPYSKIVHLLEKNNIHFPSVFMTENEDENIRFKIEFLKTIIEYNDNNDSISLLCVEHK